MLAGVLDLTVEVGDTFTFGFEWQIQDEDDNWAAVDFTGWQARMQFRKTYNAKTPLLSLTSADPDEIFLDAPNGKIFIFIGADVTETLPNGRFGVWDIEIYNPDDVEEVIRLLQGEVEFSAEVTR